MTSPFARPSDLGGGAFFKPADHMNDLALLIEPKTIARDVPSTYQGATRQRDEVLSDITVFANQGNLDSGTPSEILKSVKVTHGMLTSTLEKILGEATVAVIRKIPTQAGAGFAFRDPSVEDEAKVVTYYEAREAAITEAVASAPSFDS